MQHRMTIGTHRDKVFYRIHNIRFPNLTDWNDMMNLYYFLKFGTIELFKGKRKTSPRLA